MSYVVALVFYHEEPVITERFDNGKLCDTLVHCFLTVFRLGLFDGNGFDYLSGLVLNGQDIYAVILLLYMICMGIVLINGLIGIFGHAFIKDEVEKAIIEDNLKDFQDDDEETGKVDEEVEVRQFETKADLMELTHAIASELKELLKIMSMTEKDLIRLQDDIIVLQRRAGYVLLDPLHTLTMIII
jgi:hypothetical protein